MRLKRLHHFLFLVLLLTSCWPETGGRLLNKDTENLTAKVRRGVQHDFQRDFLHAKGQWVQSVQERNESFSIDEQDAILFQYIIANLIQSLQQSISVVSSMIRICGDTLAGVISGMVKATGGLLNLASKVLYYVSAKLEATQKHSPAFLGNFSANCAFGLKQAAPILHYAGEACIYSGEILESMTLGLGEAVQDSFWGLEVVSNSSNVIISFLLQIDEVDSIASMRKRIAQIASASLASSPNDDIGTSETAISAEASLTNANTTPSSSGPSRHIRNILHTRPHIELNTHSVDPHNKPHTSSIEVKLGKEWVAPDATVISIHDEADTATNILANDPNTDNKEHTSNPTQSYTTYNATNLVLKVRHVWSILVNKTSSIAKQLTNHTNSAYLADAASSTISPEEVADADDTTVEPILPITNNYTYIVQELPILLSEYLVYTLSLSYRILHGLTILSIQLYTTVVAAQQTESSQGAFFLLALLATYIISIIPFQSMRRKIVTLLFFITLVYCSFITTEQIQRGKLIHNTSVQSAHDLLLQQAHQRHQRAVNPRLYDNVIRDSSSMHSEFAEISVNGDVYVQSEDVITVPHYEHTPTQDVYSNINHHANQHTHQHTTHATSTHTSQSIPELTTNTTTTLLFDDAIWLNTLLTSLWVINDAHFNTQGLGAYLNEVYAEYVNIELNNIPPSVANIRLKSFDLGRAAPLFKGVRVFRVRDHLCMKQRINSEFNVGSKDDTNSPVRADNNTDQNSTSSGANESISSLQAHDTILANLWQSIENWGTNSSSSNNNNNESMPTSTNNEDGSKGSQDSMEDPNVSTSAASDPTTPTPTASTSPTKPSTAESVPSALLAPYKHLLSQFNADCDSLMIEMDTIFLSSDMNIVLSLRQALKSALPEITATLSEVSLSGQLRLKVKLTPDYPFVGDGQLSFLSAPQLGFSLNSLGGIELSSVPYAFYWVNSSMHYVLEQYTAPKYMELDLRHTLCATCDLPLVPAHDIVKVLKHGVSTAVERLKLAAVKARALWAKVDKSGRKWAVHLHHVLRLAQHHLQHHLQQGVQHVQQTIDAHTARTLGEGQDSSNGGGSSSEGSEVSSGGEGSVPRENKADNDRALHFTRYKSFDTIEENDMHPELKSEEVSKRNGGKELISQASALWKKGQTKLKEAMQNIGNDRSVNELVYML